MSAGMDWDALLAQSEELAAGDAHGFPRVERDLAQVERFSAALKERTARVVADAGADRAAAARLLAAEGVNTRRLTRALHLFEARPPPATAADGAAAPPAEATSVAAFVARVHEAAVVSAIAEAQRDAAAAHEAWADGDAEAAWAADRAGLFAAGGGGSGAAAAAALAAAATPAGLLPLPPPIPRSPAGGAALPPRLRAYVAVTAACNEAAASAGAGGPAPPPTDAVSAYAAAASAAAADAAASAASAGGAPPDPADAGVAELWAILKRQATEVAAAAAAAAASAGGGPAAHPSVLPPAAAAHAALSGSRAHLEAQFAEHMDGVIRSHRAAASLGGAPGRDGRLKAFIRVRDAAAAPFDFDVAPGGAGAPGGGGATDTTWQRVWLALRAGWAAEAAAAADAAPDAVLPSGEPLSAAIADWAAAVAPPSAGPSPPRPAGGPPPPLPALVSEAERLLRSADRSAWARPAFRHRAAVHAVLAGDARCVRAVLASAPGLCATVEDWAWFQAAAAGRATAAAAAAAAGGAGGGAAPPTPPGASSLAALQASAARPGPAHYGGRGGGAPWRYAAVLLLTVQPRGAVAFAARHPAARGPLRGEAPHLAAAAADAGLLAAGGPGDCGHPAWSGTADGGPPPASGGPPPPAASEPAPLLRAAGRALARPEPAAALEYYVAAARFGVAGLGGGKAAAAGGLALRAALLRELLTESGAVGGLLGTGGGGGAGALGGPLARFAPDPADRGALVRAVAAACEAGGQADWAAELYTHGGDAPAALRLLCGALAGCVEAAAAGGPGSAAAEAADRLVRRGNAAADAIAASGAGGGGGGGGGGMAAGDASAALDLFSALKSVRALLTSSASNDPGGVLRAAASLPFLPSDAFRLARCVDAAAALPEPLAERLSAVVPAVAAAASAAGDADRVRVLATFAGSLPQRVSRAAFERCVKLHDAMSG